MMNKYVFYFLLFFAIAATGFAQSPEAINYQAVARDGSGNLLSNQTLDVKLGVYSGSGGATLEYEETHALTTNQFGLFSLKIGEGTATTGTFGAIDWAADEHHLKVEVDDGNGYVDLGMSQLVSVPYSMHATTAETSELATDMELNDLNNVNTGSMIMNGAVLSWNGSSWGTAGDDAGPWSTNGTSVYYNAGAVGIGTDSPDMQLSVHANTGISYLRVSDGTSGNTSGVRLGMSGSGNAYLINDYSTGSLSIGTNGTTRMRMSDDGMVGINELTPDMLLHLKQQVSNRGLRIEHNSTTDYWDNGIGVTTKNYKFYYNNLFRADISSVDGAYTQSSDRRLKKNIEYMDEVLPLVNQLKPATYNYIDNEDDAVRSTGFVAQEVEPLFPNLVRDMDGGYKGVVYDGFAVISIKAIQELTEKMEEMQKEIDALKAQVGEE